ncbi:hypothetical protein ABZ370_08770 [Streptomyces sp. NPDC005962]|uniref:hypothetical protein n=1 Tax=Streptomyces sp. NPDC005962 TaxID=3154466 RepID=UPI00340B2B31
MIDPHAIPQFKGDLEQLEKDASALKRQAGKFRTTGSDVHSKFQSLSGVYHAPEAQQLFDTTTPVRDMSDVIADDLEKIAAALSAYADEVRPVKNKLRRLKHQAAAFVEKVEDDEHWKDDEEKIAEHSGLLHQVNVAVAAFQAAERRAANKIGDRFFGSTHYTVDDGSGKRGAYGYRAGDLDKAKDLPWGTPEKETHRVWELDHWGASAAKGFGIDGLGGDIDGLATLVGWHGGDKASEAWGALGDTFSGLGQYTAWPYEWAMSKTIGGGNGDNAQKKAFRESLKGFVAWDEWDKDPVRAGGQVLYNVTPFGLAGKLGKAAKGTHLAEVTKVTKVVDSVTAGTRAARAALPKASEVLAAVKGLPHWGDAPHLDRTVDAADDLAHPRDTGVRLPDGDGRPPTVLDNDGNVRHAENGEVIHDIKDARKEGDHPQQSLPEDHPAHERAPEREKATVGGGADHQPPRAHAHTGDGPSARHEPSAGRHGGGPSGGHGDGHSTGGHHGPSTSGHGDGPSSGAGRSTGGHHGSSTDNPGSGPDTPAHDGASGGGHTDTPSTSGGRDLPGGSTADNGLPGSGHPDTPGTEGLDDVAREGDDAAHGADDAAGDAGRAGDDADVPAHQTDEGTGTSDHGSVGERELTAAERKKLQDKHVWLANNNDAWFNEHYRGSDGHRWSKTKKVDGVELPILKERSGGGWVAKYDLPHGPSEVRHGRTPLKPDSADAAHLPKLNEAAKNSRVSVDLTNAETAFKEHPSVENQVALDTARDAYHDQLGDVPNNSKHSEKLGEQASRRHAIPELFRDRNPEWIRLPKTPNGANMLDDLYKLGDDGHYLVVEQKGPKANLNPPRLGAGPAANMMVKQGTKPYLETIFHEMWKRGGKDRELADALFDALEDGKLQYVLVKGKESGGSYDGAVLEHLQIY